MKTLTEYRRALRDAGKKSYGQREHARLRARVLSAYGSACACCTESTPEFLGMDHIDGGGRRHRAELKSSIYRWLVKNNFPSGFRILCHNCNLALGAYGYCPHNGRPTQEDLTTPAEKLRGRLLAAARSLVARGIYPSHKKLQHELGSGNPSGIARHRQALIAEGLWPNANEHAAIIKKFTPCRNGLDTVR